MVERNMEAWSVGRAIAGIAADVVVLCVMLGVSAMACAQTNPNSLLGTWVGSLKYEGKTQSMALRFELDENKALVIFLSQPEMKFYNMGPGPVEQQGEEFQAPPLSFKLSPDKKRISGVMSFDGNDPTFELEPGVAPVAPARKEMAGYVAQPVWIFKTGGEIWSPPAIDDGAVYFGSNDGFIYSLRAGNGKLVWQTKTRMPVLGRPTIKDEYLYVLSDDGFLYKLEKRTGATVWRFDTHGGSIKRDWPNPPDHLAYDYLTSAATVDEDTVYVGSADKSLYAIDLKTGRQKWRFETKDIVRSTPALAEGMVFFGSRDHYIYAVDARTGVLKWKLDTLREVVSSPLVANGIVFIGSRCSDLFALDAMTGQVKWKFFYWSSWVESSARIRDGVLYIGSSDYQQMLAIEAASGREVWQFDTGGSAWSTPAVTDKLVYIGAVGIPNLDYIDHRGDFFAVDRFTGKLIWHYPMHAIAGARTYGVASSPVVDQGLVFFGGLDGLFYAFRDGN